MTLIFVGPDPTSPHIAHAGGQLTATTGFSEFAAERSMRVEWIDTAQSNFPVPPAHTRIARAVRRMARFVRLTASRDSTGVILFSGAGASFVERSIMALIARLFRKPSLLMIRSGHFRTHYDGSALFRALSRLFLRIPDRVGVQGESWIPFLRKAGVARDRIVVVPNWLSTPARSPRIRHVAPDRPLRLLFAGWMTSHKGVPELIEAARELAREERNFALVLAGGGTLFESARAMAAEQEFAGRLLVTGWLSRDELAIELAAADLLILPSHAEGFPNIVMEALAEGIPAIVTPVGAIPDSVTDGVNGTIVPVNDARAIASAVRRYFDSPNILERQSRGALGTAAERHDRDINCTILLAALSGARDDFAEGNR
jgi:glycosyltransferase involved in cell wall biosynthesis